MLGLIRFLIVIAPPQHGKSEPTSRRLPAYWLGTRPNDPVCIVSYGADLARGMSRTARDIVQSEEFARLFPDPASGYDAPIKLRGDSQAVGLWELAWPYRGFCWAGGVGGPITGHGFKLGIVDDPFENWAQAQSLTIRNHVWDWWRNTFRTRIRADGAIVIMMTRWHEDDVIGRLIELEGDKWDILRLPAVGETQEERDDNNRRLGLPEGLPDPVGREPGEPLCPEMYDEEALAELRESVGSLGWWAEYMGSPRQPQGNVIKREWLAHFVDEVPRQAQRVRYWDKAGTAGGGAFSAGVLLADDSIDTYVEDVVRGQWSALQRELVIRQVAELDAQNYGDEVTIYVEQEPGSGGKESAENTIRNLKEFTVYRDPATGDKDVRLRPFAAHAEAGMVKLLRAKWNGPYIDELCAVPHGQYRDMADATAGAYNKLARRQKRKAKSHQG